MIAESKYTVKELIELLERFHKPDEVIAYSLWTREDVKAVASGWNGKKHKLTRKQVDLVLQWINRRWDANIGINWDLIDFAIGVILKDS